MNKTICFASVVSEIAQSDLYMTVKARLFETPKANLNGARVTPAFMDEIVEHEEKYVGLPLSADVKALARGNYDHLGHLYDARTGEFKSAMIGSFYHFEKEEFDGGAYLVGYARIMKRYKAVCKAVAELFADSALKFSFEVSVGEYLKLEDGTIQIDVADCNFLEGVAIVTLPACEDAVALELVAECNRIEEDEKKRGEKEMTEAENKQAEEMQAEVQTKTIETETAEAAEPIEAECSAEIEESSESKETASQEAQTEVNAEAETAEQYVTEHIEIEQRTEIYDTDTDQLTIVEDEHRETVHTTVTEEEPKAEEIAEETAGEKSEETAEEKVVAEGETPTEEPASEETPAETSVEEVVQPGAEDTKKLAEVIAALSETVAALQKEVAELKAKPVTVVAEQTPITAEINPFTDTIKVENGSKYSLLEKEEKNTSYTLLSK